MSGLGLTFLRRGGQAHPTAGSDYILSENRGDPEVFRILMAKGVSSDGVGITLDDAAKVKSIGTWFRGNTIIQSFKELKHFVQLTQLGYNNYLTAAFDGCNNLQVIELPESITYIGVNCFANCNLQSCPSLKNVKTLRDSAFSGNTAMTGKVEIFCGSEKNIFYQCTSIEEVVIRNATTIGAGSNNSITGAFAGCTSLKRAIIYEGITTISPYTFQGCSALESLIIHEPTPPTQNGTILNGANNAIIYVPDEAVEAYKTSWATYSSRIKPLSEYNG